MSELIKEENESIKKHEVVNAKEFLKNTLKDQEAEKGKEKNEQHRIESKHKNSIMRFSKDDDILKSAVEEGILIKQKSNDDGYTSYKLNDKYYSVDKLEYFLPEEIKGNEDWWLFRDDFRIYGDPILYPICNVYTDWSYDDISYDDIDIYYDYSYLSKMIALKHKFNENNIECQVVNSKEISCVTESTTENEIDITVLDMINYVVNFIKDKDYKNFNIVINIEDIEFSIKKEELKAIKK
jgi:hypothetical protein